MRVVSGPSLAQGPPGTVPLAHAGRGVRPASLGGRLPPGQPPGTGPLGGPGSLPLGGRVLPGRGAMLPGRGGMLPGWAAPTVQAPQHAIVDLAGDFLLLQHLLDGLPGRAGLDRLPALAGLLGLGGNTEITLPVGLGAMNQRVASQDIGGTSQTPGKETHAVRAGWGLSPSPETRAPRWPALPSAHGPPSSPQPSCASSGTTQGRGWPSAGERLPAQPGGVRSGP